MPALVLVLTAALAAPIACRTYGACLAARVHALEGGASGPHPAPVDA